MNFAASTLTSLEGRVGGFVPLGSVRWEGRDYIAQFKSVLVVAVRTIPSRRCIVISLGCFCIGKYRIRYQESSEPVQCATRAIRGEDRYRGIQDAHTHHVLIMSDCRSEPPKFRF